MQAPNKNSRGFTIIEVVLVLAIAGLIFLVVFLALPALQRGQRDQQRKQDQGRFISQLTAYQSNNQGALPTAWTGSSSFVTNYLTNNQAFKDPSTGNDYTITSPTPTTNAAAPIAGQVFVYLSASCSNAGTSGVAPLSPVNNRVVAVVFYQEQGTLSCQSNQ